MTDNKVIVGKWPFLYAFRFKQKGDALMHLVLKNNDTDSQSKGIQGAYVCIGESFTRMPATQQLSFAIDNCCFVNYCQFCYCINIVILTVHLYYVYIDIYIDSCICQLLTGNIEVALSPLRVMLQMRTGTRRCLPFQA